MESLVYFNDRRAYRNFLSQPAWIIARPLFALINLGWHVTTPLGKYIYNIYSRYPKEIMKMEQHFSALQCWLQK